jgi:hypothetical protein
MEDCRIDVNCCICLDENQENKIELLCCKNNIHSECLFLIFMEKIYQCPLCRGFIDPYQYITIANLYDILKKTNTKIDLYKLDCLLWKSCNNVISFLYNK